MMDSLVGFGILGLGLMLLVPILLFAFWIWILVDCLQRTFKDRSDKVIWILVILIAHILGALIYYVVIKRKN